ncbi:MAG TPA: site-specific integrase [Verrucomicrobiae bacterium]|nr:site-specific integrase [Verrucomicrobiae bacterium]
MAYVRKHPLSPYWFAIITRADGSRTSKTTQIPHSIRNRARAQAVAEDFQRAEDKTEKAEPIRNKEAVRGALFEAIQKTEDGTFTEATARETLNRILESMGQEPMRLVSIGEYLNSWQESKGVTKSATTAKRYAQTVRDFLSFLGDRAGASLGALMPNDFEGFRDLQIEQGKSPGTANMALKVMRIPMNLARRQGLILTNPAEGVDLLPAESGVRSTFTREQIRALLAVADVEWRGMILLGVCHGLRIGDAARLTWANIDPERGTLRFHPQKTARGARRLPEEYPLHSDVAEYIEALPVSESPTAPLFPTLYKLKVGSRYGLSDGFRRLMRRVGIIAEGEGEAKKRGKGRRFFELGFHSLRHTAISEMANRGVSKEVRMKLSGHKSAVHERYTHHELETLRRAIDAVPSFTREK